MKVPVTNLANTVEIQITEHLASLVTGRPLSVKTITAGAGNRMLNTIICGDALSMLKTLPIFGSGTTGLVADKMGRKWIGIELNPEYVALAKKRLQQETLL